MDRSPGLKKVVVVERWPLVEVRLYSVPLSSRFKAHRHYNEPLFC